MKGKGTLFIFIYILFIFLYNDSEFSIITFCNNTTINIKLIDNEVNSVIEGIILKPEFQEIYMSVKSLLRSLKTLIRRRIC